MNKKGQYMEPPKPSYNNVHPVLIIGIIIFVIPFFFPVVNIDAPKIVTNIMSGLGIFTIIAGGVLSILKAS